MDCNEVRDLLEAYVLDALDPDEHSLVAVHLADCANCQSRLAEYEAVSAMLPAALAAASSVHPPDALKDRILQAIDAPPVAESGLTTRPGPDGRGISTHGSSTQHSRRRLLMPLAAAVLVLVLLALGTGLSVVLAREQALRAELANLTGQQELVLEVVDSSKMSKVVLRPPAESGSTSYGKLYTRPDLPNVVAMAARLPQPPPGQAYHLWVSQRGQLRLAGVLTINDQGFGMLVFNADQPGPTYDSIQLTLQPMGGKTPLEPAVLTGKSANQS